METWEGRLLDGFSCSLCHTVRLGDKEPEQGIPEIFLCSLHKHPFAQLMCSRDA